MSIIFNFPPPKDKFFDEGLFLGMFLGKFFSSDCLRLWPLPQGLIQPLVGIKKHDALLLLLSVFLSAGSCAGVQAIGIFTTLLPFRL